MPFSKPTLKNAPSVVATGKPMSVIRTLLALKTPAARVMEFMLLNDRAP
ncbi:MAG: hypothetical protein HUU60_10180 [Armatimonadetes bacterium]|nr:hypothetical protein [Armatimonadota bacterium]